MLFITGFSSVEVYPFGPVQLKVYGATPPLGFAVRVKLSPSQIDVEEAVGLVVGSANTRFVFLINPEFTLISEITDSTFRANAALLILELLADELKVKRLENRATNK